MAYALVKTKLPHHHKKNTLAQDATWFTWSPDFKDFIRLIRKSGSIRRSITMVDVPECMPYGKTYTTQFSKLTADEQQLALNFADDLLTYDPKASPLCFRDMVNPLMSSKELRVIFTLLREAMVHIMGHRSHALYSPVTPERLDPGFNLHADLFLTNKLWLIFDDVPHDGSGAALLLTKKHLLAIAKKHPQIPQKIINDLADIMSRKLTRDAYNYCWSIIHGTSRPWCDSLNEQLQERAYQMAFKPGEGYLIDDRQWLHGRMPVSIRVSSSRFHRLTF